jgi:hypothetical protein
MAIGKGVLLGGLMLGALGLVAATAKAKPKAGEPGGTPASALPGAGQQVPVQVAAIMIEAMKTGNPAVIRKTADELEKGGYLAQAADLRAGAVIIEQEQAKVKAQGSSAMAESLKSVAIATGDPARMRKTAEELRKGGYASQATELEQVASVLESVPTTVAMPSMPTPTVAVPSMPIPKAPSVSVPAPAATPVSVTIPTFTPAALPTLATTPATQVLPQVVVTAPAPTPAPSASAANRAAFAGRTALMLQSSKKGTEDEGTVMAYQQQENLRKQDGKYGSETGLSFANTYDIVPPKPFYWGTKAGGYSSYVADKKQYKAALLRKAAADPQRSEEWTRAAAV